MHRLPAYFDNPVLSLIMMGNTEQQVKESLKKIILEAPTAKWNKVKPLISVTPLELCLQVSTQYSLCSYMYVRKITNSGLVQICGLNY